MKFLGFLKNEATMQFMKFSLVGVSNTLLDLGIFYLLSVYTPLYYIVINLISFSVGILNSYFWNRFWTFKSLNKQISQEFFKFILTNIIGLILNTLLLSWLIEILHLPQFLSKVFATLLVLFWNFFISKYWTFKNFSPN